MHSFFCLWKIFIDYGKNWETAWEEHVQSWKSLSKDYDVKTYGAIMGRIEDLRSVEELKDTPYPDNTDLLCYGGKIVDDEMDDYKDNEETTIDGTRGFDGNEDELDEPDFLMPCEILEKDDHEDRYTVLIERESVKFTVENYPKSSIRLMIKPYTSDQHIYDAFRHFMEIPDDIFPQHWKIDSPIPNDKEF